MNLDIVTVTDDFNFNDDSNAYYTYYMIDPSVNAKNINITLPSIAYDGYYNQLIKINDNTDTYTVTLLPSGTDTINGAGSSVLLHQKLCKIISLTTPSNNWLLQFQDFSY